MDCYIWYSEEGTGRGPSPPRPLLTDRQTNDTDNHRDRQTDKQTNLDTDNQ